MAHTINSYSLVADIGGTNTRIALAHGISLVPDTVRRYPNSDFSSLQDVIARYIQDEGGVAVCAVCVAVAGPVDGAQASLTNLDWSIDAATLTSSTNADTVAILNDLQAQGYALGHLPKENIATVMSGAASSATATQLVVGIGTGFNAAPVFETPKGRFVAPSESGHMDMPMRTGSELDLGRAIADHSDEPSVEDALSGRGLPKIYHALHPSRPQLAGREILELAADGDAAANGAVRAFVEMMGKVCGNLALVQLPFGGINLVGGMARAMHPYLATHGFADGFLSKGRFTDYMNRFPVNIVTDDYAALTGCAVMLDQNQT